MVISLTTCKRILLSFTLGLLLVCGLMPFRSPALMPLATVAQANSVTAVAITGDVDEASSLETRSTTPPEPLPAWIMQVDQVPSATLDHSHHAHYVVPAIADQALDAKTDPHGLGLVNKTIAIDTAPDTGVAAPNVVEMNEVQVAAQIWASASFPVEGFQAYTSPFGYRSSPTGGYRKEFHYGLDIAAPRRSYIRNWWAGTVVEVSDGSNCGTSAVIRSGNWTHIYCHMQGRVENRGGSRYLVDREGGVELRQGQQIAAGDRIGRVGMTGRTTGPHLHWGLKYQNNWVDPAWVLQAMAASYNALYGQ